jgi:hypothetical protein
MAYSPLEKSYMDSVAEYLLPQANAQPDESEMQLASSNQVTSDAPGIVPIPQTGFEKIMEKTGLTLEQIGSELDKLGKVKLGGIEIGIRDLLPFVGSVEDGKLTGTPAALQAAGRGESLITGTGFTTQLKPDAKLMALDVATAGVIKPAAKAGKAAVKKVIDAGKNLPVGMSIKMLDGTEQVLDKAPKIETKAFKNWFGESKAIDEGGKPVVMYHGTGGNFEEFRRSFRGAIFVTPDPDFAESFTGLVKGVGKGGKEFVDEQAGTPVIMPLYVKATNPFDYENPKDVEKVIKHLHDTRQFPGVQPGWFEGGKWDKIEDRDVQKAIKDLGYDSFYVEEGGIKNLGVYDPRQVKSAIGNIGTFDPKNPNILRGAGAGTAGAAATQEENK